MVVMVSWLCFTLSHPPSFPTLFGVFLLLLLFVFASLIRIMFVIHNIKRETARGIITAAAAHCCRWNVKMAHAQWQCYGFAVCRPNVSKQNDPAAVAVAAVALSTMHFIHTSLNGYKFIVSSVNRVSTVWTAALAGSSFHTKRVLQFNWNLKHFEWKTFKWNNVIDKEEKIEGKKS